MNIPLVDLQRNYRKHKDNYERILIDAASSCQFILGDGLRRFESRFAEYLGVKHVLGVGSGTDALTLLLKASGVKGKKVLIQDNTFIATALAVINAGAELMICDVNPDTYQMDVDSYTGLEPDVVMPVHLYGYPADMDAIRRRFSSALIIEDACQAHGSCYQGRPCGSLGAGAGFSFYPGKNLGAFGDGGAVATDDDNLAEEVAALRNWGGKRKYIHDREGGNSRLDTLQAVILEFKLGMLDEWNAARRRVGGLYRKLLGNCESLRMPPEVSGNSVQNYHLFVVRLTGHDRDVVLSKLHELGIFAGIHYPVPVHRQKVYESMPFAAMNFPVSTEVCGQIISLPMFPEMTDSEVEYVSDGLLKILKV